MTKACLRCDKWILISYLWLDEYCVQFIDRRKFGITGSNKNTNLVWFWICSFYYSLLLLSLPKIQWGEDSRINLWFYDCPRNIKNNPKRAQLMNKNFPLKYDELFVHACNKEMMKQNNPFSDSERMQEKKKTLRNLITTSLSSWSTRLSAWLESR